MIDLVAHDIDFDRREREFFARSGMKWLTDPQFISIRLPSDVHAELKERADHDGVSLEERVAWLLTELVRRNRKRQ